jgi:hypothetical protein
MGRNEKVTGIMSSSLLSASRVTEKVSGFPTLKGDFVTVPRSVSSVSDQSKVSPAELVFKSSCVSLFSPARASTGNWAAIMVR